jgi:hypothetical protein
MENQFDNLIKAKLERAEMVPPADLWTKLEGKLDAFEKPIEEHPSSPKIVWSVGIAAAVTAIAALLSFLVWSTSPSNTKKVQAKLPVQKSDVKIGDEMIPAINVITVSEVKSEPKQLAKSKPNQAAKHEINKVELDHTLAKIEELKTDIEDFQPPVYSLKLNSKKISPSLNEKITIISGEPKNVEIDEHVNAKRVIIYKRLQLINQSKNLPFSSEK